MANKDQIFADIQRERMLRKIQEERDSRAPSQNSDSTLTGRLQERVGKTADMFQRQFSGGPMQDVSNVPIAAALGAGQVVGAAGDVAFTGLTKFAKAVTPDVIEEKLGEWAGNIIDSEPAQKALGFVASGVKKLEDISEDFPDTAMAIDSLVNLSAIGGLKVATKEPAKELIRLSMDAKRLISVPDREIMMSVKNGITKGIRPTVVGKKSTQLTDEYFKKAKSAVETIVENKDKLVFVGDDGTVIKGALPKTINEFGQSIDILKESIFKEYDRLAKETTERINLLPMVEELETFARNPSVWVVNKGASRHAIQLAEDLESLGNISAEKAQEMLKNLNFQLKSFYKNPSYETAHQAAVDARFSDYLRKMLDEKITSATGEGYGDLKKKYGALKALEEEVNHRAIVDMRKNPKGLIDFSDIFTSTQAIYAIANKNPALFAASATGKMISTYYRKLNDPNTAIEKMFKSVDRLAGQKKQYRSDIIDNFVKARDFKDIDIKNKQYFESINKTGIE